MPDPAEQAESAAVRLVTPTANDVLCGREKACFDHLGSRHFRQVIQSYRQRYEEALTKYDKMQLLKDICNQVRATSRFLKYNDEAGGWEEISIAASRDKVSHALRFANRSSPKRITKEDPVELEELASDPEVSGSSARPAAARIPLAGLGAGSPESSQSAQSVGASAAMAAIANRLLSQANVGPAQEGSHEAHQAPSPPADHQAQQPDPNSRIVEALWSLFVERPGNELAAFASSEGLRLSQQAAHGTLPSSPPPYMMTTAATGGPIMLTSGPSSTQNIHHSQQVAQLLRQMQQQYQPSAPSPPPNPNLGELQSQWLQQLTRELQQQQGQQTPAAAPNNTESDMLAQLMQQQQQVPQPARASIPNPSNNSQFSDAELLQLSELMRNLEQQQQQLLQPDTNDNTSAVNAQLERLIQNLHQERLSATTEQSQIDPFLNNLQRQQPAPLGSSSAQSGAPNIPQLLQQHRVTTDLTLTTAQFQLSQLLSPTSASRTTSSQNPNDIANLYLQLSRLLNSNAPQGPRIQPGDDDRKPPAR